MQSGEKLQRKELDVDETLVEQGEGGNELFLLIDGVLAVDVDGEEVAEIGPGAILGERAILEGGKRTATLRARTRARVAVVPADRIHPAHMQALAAGRTER
jgi:CRP-like cAMP-binding protein